MDKLDEIPFAIFLNYSPFVERLTHLKHFHQQLVRFNNIGVCIQFVSNKNK